MLRTLRFAMLGLALLGSPVHALVAERGAGKTTAAPIDEAADAAAVASPLARRSLEAMPALQLPIGEFGAFGHTAPAEATPAPANEVDGAFDCGSDEESGVSGLFTPPVK